MASSASTTCSSSSPLGASASREQLHANTPAHICVNDAVWGRARGHDRRSEDYPTIQDAIGAASNGDTIAIAAGTYFEHDVNAYGKELIITGAIKENGTPATTIDAQQQGRVLVAWGAEVSSTSFQNLILTGGFSKLGGACTTTTAVQVSSTASSPAMFRPTTVVGCIPTGALH